MNSWADLLKIATHLNVNWRSVYKHSGPKGIKVHSDLVVFVAVIRWDFSRQWVLSFLEFSEYRKIWVKFSFCLSEQNGWDFRVPSIWIFSNKSYLVISEVEVKAVVLPQAAALRLKRHCRIARLAPALWTEDLEKTGRNLPLLMRWFLCHPSVRQRRTPLL